MRRSVGRALPTALVAVVLAAGCTESAPDRLPRSARYGIFNELLLHRRDGSAGGPFFLDRLEVTRADWRRFAERTGASGSHPEVSDRDPGQDSLPVCDVDYWQARAYARWRFCRLPRIDEWEFAATGRGARYAYPWGNLFIREWVNSWELGLGVATPVGAFESGRDVGGAYDLLGNVAEWTESVPPSWFDEAGMHWRPRIYRGLALLDAAGAVQPWRLDGLPWPGSWLRWAVRAREAGVGSESLWRGAFRGLLEVERTVAMAVWELEPLPPPGGWVYRVDVTPHEVEPVDEPRRQAARLAERIDVAEAVPALAVWRLPGLPVSAAELIAAAGPTLPRCVVGGHFRSELGNWWTSRSFDGLGAFWQRPPGEWGETVGVCLAADPLGLLVALLREPAPPTDLERATLGAFLRRLEHREVLAPELPRALRRVPDPGPLLGLLRRELGG